MSPSAVQTSVFFVTFAVSVFSLWWVISSRRKKHYVRVGKVSKLYIYPVKSLKGIEVSSAFCHEKGFHVNGCDDRYYMLISDDGVLCSQRQEPRLVLLTPSISGNRLHISGPEMETLTLDLKPAVSPNDKIISCRVFTEEAPAVDCGDEASAWFQKYLNRSDVRLVYNAQDLKQRKCIKDNPLFKKFRKENIVAFQDGFPFHLMSQESIDNLNSKMQDSKVSVKNFRPNVLVEGCSPFGEDKWRYIKFSSGAQMTHIAPCGRCVLTTNDPETAVKTNKEPLVTLRTYRAPTDEKIKAALGLGPLLGVYCGLLEKGKIAVGDDVFAVVEHKPFKY